MVLVLVLVLVHYQHNHCSGDVMVFFSSGNVYNSFDVIIVADQLIKKRICAMCTYFCYNEKMTDKIIAILLPLIDLLL